MTATADPEPPPQGMGLGLGLVWADVQSSNRITGVAQGFVPTSPLHIRSGAVCKIKRIHRPSTTSRRLLSFFSFPQRMYRPGLHRPHGSARMTTNGSSSSTMRGLPTQNQTVCLNRTFQLRTRSGQSAPQQPYARLPVA